MQQEREMVDCPHCGGLGDDASDQNGVCANCHGLGEVAAGCYNGTGGGLVVFERTGRSYHKLYRVTVEVEMICYAESITDAEGVARRYLFDATSELDDATFSARELKDLARRERTCLPWGDPEERTCAEILEANT